MIGPLAYARPLCLAGLRFLDSETIVITLVSSLRTALLQMPRLRPLEGDQIEPGLRHTSAGLNPLLPAPVRNLWRIATTAFVLLTTSQIKHKLSSQSSDCMQQTHAWT